MAAACRRAFSCISARSPVTVTAALPGKPPRMSVVVPFYNVEEFIASCIDGLRAQTFPRERFEIILVNNNSTDESARIAARYDDVTVLNQPVSGSYAARNMGIGKARGEIIVTIDPDCRPDAD